jgi:uncharacterized Zn finger protein
VEGGLVARSARGDIGQQWWSRRFVEVLESFALGTRLTRGRNYARRGQVISLEVAAGRVSAAVQGSRRTPYRVTVELAPFSPLVWAKVEVELAQQAIHSAKLLAGELPADLEEVFAACGAPLFPARAADLTMACSCPDVAVPCKHLAATFYLLAESFDDDPFRFLAWRGREREALLARLRELRGTDPVDGDGTADVADAGRRRPLGAALALDDVPPRPDADAAAFWQGAPTPPLPTHPELPVDLLLRPLADPAAEVGGAELLERLRPLYRRLSGE